MDVRKSLIEQQATFLNNIILTSSMSQSEKLQALHSINTIYSVADWYEKRNSNLEISCSSMKHEIEALEKMPSYEDCLADIKVVKRELKHFAKTTSRKSFAKAIWVVQAEYYVKLIANLQNRLSVLRNRRG